MHEVDKLVLHASKGCLSSIPPGCGTNRNEAFHKLLNSILRRTKVSILLSYAFITVAIFSHNNNIDKPGKRLVRSVKHSSGRKSSLEIMGFPNQKVREEVKSTCGGSL